MQETAIEKYQNSFKQKITSFFSSLFSIVIFVFFLGLIAVGFVFVPIGIGIGIGIGLGICIGVFTFFVAFANGSQSKRIIIEAKVINIEYD